MQAITKHRDYLREAITDLEVRQDDLLDKLGN
jgi:hypothetical protein